MRVYVVSFDVDLLDDGCFFFDQNFDDFFFKFIFIQFISVQICIKNEKEKI